MKKLRVHAYPDRLSVRAGEKVSFMVSGEGAATFDAKLMRLVHGDENPLGPGLIEEHILSGADGSWPLKKQSTQLGSFVRVGDPRGKLTLAGSFTIYAFVSANRAAGARQTLLSRWSAKAQAGYCLDLNERGCLELKIGNGLHIETLSCDTPLHPNLWYLAYASFDAVSAQGVVGFKLAVNRYNSLYSPIVRLERTATNSAPFRVSAGDAQGGEFLIAASATGTPDDNIFAMQCFNGKIDRCGVYDRALLPAELEATSAGAAPSLDGAVALWDPTIGYSNTGIGDRIVDIGPNGLHGEGFNGPVRGQTGWNWTGHSDCFRLAPDQFGGIEFHEDSLTDCRWAPTVSIVLPMDLRSGVYGLKLEVRSGSETAIFYGVFFVRATVPKAPICLLLPTATYLAYANGQGSMEGDVAQAIMSRAAVFQRADIEACEDGYEHGLSTYSVHADGAGVCYSSARRPIFTMQPNYRQPGVSCAWGLPADLSLVAWLDHAGYDYDILTDEDLHRDGIDALLPYRTIINASHAEYYSERMLDATEDYLAQGGRVLYLSGNGYYWVVAFRPEEPWVMEIRRSDSGSRAWQSRPGESYLATTGERGGLWRLRGRPPQKLVGVGFSSEAMDVSVGFHRARSSYDPASAWIFDGVQDKVIGDFGLAYDGAVGLEIDRFDSKLGSPPDAAILASSEPLTSNWPVAQEDVMFMYPGLEGSLNSGVRCDMVYFQTTNGGAVFSTSSIAWSSALPINNFDNNVSRIMRNVVDAFSKPDVLPEMRAP